MLHPVFLGNKINIDDVSSVEYAYSVVKVKLNEYWPTCVYGSSFVSSDLD